MKRALLALASPLLILLALLGLLSRQGADRLQTLPALLVGSGLLAYSGFQWKRRRRALLAALREPPPEACGPPP